MAQIKTFGINSQQLVQEHGESAKVLYFRLWELVRQTEYIQSDNTEDTRQIKDTSGLCSTS